MNAQNKRKNAATKVMSMMMSAIYLALSVKVPVMAAVTSDVAITDGSYDDDVVVNNATGVDANGNTEVSVSNNLSVTSEERFTKGIEACPNVNETATVTIGKDLSVTSSSNEEGQSTTGIEARPSADGTVNITIGNPDTNEGNLTVSGGDTVRGIYTAVNNVSTSQGITNITVGRNVESTAESGHATGVHIADFHDGSETNVDIGGHVNANGITAAEGLRVFTNADSDTRIDVGKGISASAATATGVYIMATNSANTTINIGKDSDGNAVTVISNSAGGAAGSSGIYETLETDSNVTVNVEGNIVVNSNAAGAKGIYANGGGGINLKTQIKGDVTSNGAGIYTEDTGNSASVDFVIDGTLRSTADGVPAVVLDTDGINRNTVSVTAWKIESNDDAELFGKNAGSEIITTEQAQNAVADLISYIIRVTQPEINNAPGNVISLAKENGTAWDKTKAWSNGENTAPTMLNVACENEPVYLRLDVPEGYQLVGVYADAERTVALTRAENGSYFLTVPRGGGLDVNVILSLISVDSDGSADNNTSEPPAVSAPGSAVITGARIQSMILDQRSAMQNLGQAVTVIDLYLGDTPDLSEDAVLALFAGNVSKRCHFTYKGRKYVLFMPVTDTGSAAFAQCLALLHAEPRSKAGPLRVEQIFAPVGATVSQE